MFAATAASFLGIVMLWSLPLDRVLRVFACGMWLTFSGSELAEIASGHRRMLRIRLYGNGDVELENGDANWQPATLRSGCLVLRRFAWLCIQMGEGFTAYELVRGDCRESEQWRRFQVIWRHLGGRLRNC